LGESLGVWRGQIERRAQLTLEITSLRKAERQVEQEQLKRNGDVAARATELLNTQTLKTESDIKLRTAQTEMQRNVEAREVELRRLQRLEHFAR
jgi:hypothetical protein